MLFGVYAYLSYNNTVKTLYIRGIETSFKICRKFIFKTYAASQYILINQTDKIHILD